MTVDHPWASPWWSWTLMLQPIIFFHEAEDSLLTISANDNPILWWGSTLTVVLSLGEVAHCVIAGKPAADHSLVPVLLSRVALLLPWVASTRASFIYHCLPYYVFFLLALVY